KPSLLAALRLAFLKRNEPWKRTPRAAVKEFQSRRQAPKQLLCRVTISLLVLARNGEIRIISLDPLLFDLKICGNSKETLSRTFAPSREQMIQKSYLPWAAADTRIGEHQSLQCLLVFGCELLIGTRPQSERRHMVVNTLPRN